MHAQTLACTVQEQAIQGRKEQGVGAYCMPAAAAPAAAEAAAAALAAALAAAASAAAAASTAALAQAEQSRWAGRQVHPMAPVALASCR